MFLMDEAAAAFASSSTMRQPGNYAGSCGGEREASQQQEEDFLQHHVDRIEHLQPFLESMTPGAGFRCLAFFLLQHLLHSREGYDARIRRSIKVLGVLLLVHDMEEEEEEEGEGFEDGGGGGAPSGFGNFAAQDKVRVATRRFESLEHAIAARLMRLSREQERAGVGRASSSQGRRRQQQQQSSSTAIVVKSDFLSREQFLRGLKIGGAAVVAGTIFAVTGGLAAPGIAAGLATVAG